MLEETFTNTAKRVYLYQENMSRRAAGRVIVSCVHLESGCGPTTRQLGQRLRGAPGVLLASTACTAGVFLPAEEDRLRRRSKEA